jgi:hypothetical protein
MDVFQLSLPQKELEVVEQRKHSVQGGVGSLGSPGSEPKL